VKRQTTFQFAVREAQHVADVHVVEPPLELRADADLALPRREAAALDDLDVATDLERLVRHAARTTLATSNSLPPSRGMLMTMYVSGLMSGVRRPPWRCAATTR
jgi:hypothetical protein